MQAKATGKRLKSSGPLASSVKTSIRRRLSRVLEAQKSNADLQNLIGRGSSAMGHGRAFLSCLV